MDKNAVSRATQLIRQARDFIRANPNPRVDAARRRLLDRQRNQEAQQTGSFNLLAGDPRLRAAVGKDNLERVSGIAGGIKAVPGASGAGRATIGAAQKAAQSGSRKFLAQFDDAINSKNFEKARQIIDDLPAGSQFKGSMESVLKMVSGSGKQLGNRFGFIAGLGPRRLRNTLGPDDFRELDTARDILKQRKLKGTPAFRRAVKTIDDLSDLTVSRSKIDSLKGNSLKLANEIAKKIGERKPPINIPNLLPSIRR